MLLPLAALTTLLAAGQVVQSVEPQDVSAVRLASPVTVDGRLDEPAWTAVPVIEGFLQRDPQEGAAPTERTDVRIAYDDDAVYVGARLFDSAPKDIVSRLGRRDADLGGDEFTFYVDPYHDGRTGFYFAVSAAGSLRDGTLYNDDWNDSSWDGIWEGRAVVDGEGWTVEMRIPYSQLRFHREARYRWGVNFRRYLGRKKEESYLVYTPKAASGFVSRFHKLSGVEGVKPPRLVLVRPYSTIKAELTPHESGDPFNDGSRMRPALGVDARIGLGSNLTVDATFNPDFGQVEVDPAVVNLSDVETFFPEKRPFFVEGASAFHFGHGGATNYFGFSWPGPDLFYTRRIGRAPQGGVDDADFLDSPEGARIFGAAKLTGKLGGRWNLGVLHAVTARETARAFAQGRRFDAEVEPPSQYAVVRIQREFPDNRRGFGLIATGVGRSLGDSRLRDELNDTAFVLGLDGWTFLDAKKTWVVTGWAAASRVSGTAARITELQRGSQHYWQRPDATHVEVDPRATSLSGFVARTTVNKEKGNVLFNAAFGAIDPGFDSNDLGFLWRGDVVNGHVWTGYKWTKETRFARAADVGFAYFRSQDFGGNTTWQGFFAMGSARFKNEYRLSAWGAYNPESLNPNRTRGGPYMLNPHGWEWDTGLSTDDRRRVSGRVGIHGQDYAHDADWYRGVSTSLDVRPRSNILVSLAPELLWARTTAQYIDTVDDPLALATYGQRYVFATLDQRQFVAGIRLNWTFTPRLSLELYAQPLVSSGAYSRYGELARPRSFSIRQYGTDGSTFDAATHQVDPDGDGPASTFDIDPPDFNFRSLRGNLVLRWEFRPGSTAYAVWTQNRSDEEDVGRFALGRSVSRLFAAQADNILLIKVAHSWGQ